MEINGTVLTPKQYETLYSQLNDEQKKGLRPEDITIVTTVTSTTTIYIKNKAFLTFSSKIITSLGGKAALTSLGAKVSAAAATIFTWPVGLGVAGTICIGYGIYRYVNKDENKEKSNQPTVNLSLA